MAKLGEFVKEKFFGREVGGKVIRFRVGVEKLINELDGVLERENVDSLLLFSAPTGYGKSVTSVAIASYLANEAPKGIARVVHVLPFRSMVEDLAFRASAISRALGLGISVGAQCSSPLGSLKDPTFLRDYVVTTMDSYALNLFKVTVFMYTTYAHYEMPRAHIYTSLNVFDEAHLFIEAGRPFVALTTSIACLAKAEVPTLMLTATIPTHLVYALQQALDRVNASLKIKAVYVAKPDPKKSFPKKTLSSLEMIEDSDWLNTSLSVRYRTKILDSVDQALRIAIDIASSVDRALIVENTPSKCVETLRSILRNANLSAIAIHGRMRSIDRRLLTSRLSTFKGFVIATQVVEAGVDLDAGVLVSDAAPVPQLVQRIGRLCRDLDRHCGETCEAMIVTRGYSDDLYSPYRRDFVEQALNSIKLAVSKYGEEGILWRTPSFGAISVGVGKGATTYLRLLEHWASKVGLDSVYKFDRDDELLARLLTNIDTIVTLRSDVAREVMNSVGSFVRDYPMVPLILVRGIDKDVLSRTPQSVVEELESRIVDEVVEYVKRGVKVFERELATLVMTYFSIAMDARTLSNLLSDIAIEREGGKYLALLLFDEEIPRVYFESVVRIERMLESVLKGNAEKWFSYLERLSERLGATPIGFVAPWSDSMVVEGFEINGLEIPIGIVV